MKADIYGEGVDGVHVASRDLIRLRARAGGLGLSPRRRVLSAQAGGYRSVYQGRGMEFDEARPYQPGDDIRSMEWRVTARTGRPYTKLFREERERPVLFLVDLSPSMYFATRGALKALRAVEAAALVAWAAVDNGDRAGAILASGRRHAEVRPAGREHGALRLVRALVRAYGEGLERAADAAGGTLSPALDRLLHIGRPGALVLLLSDFQGMDGDGERRLARLSRHQDVVLVAIHDPLEAEPPAPGLYPVLEAGRRAVLDTTDRALARAWRERYVAHRERLHELSRRYGLHLIELATDAPLVETLRRGLHLRSVLPARP